MNHILLIEFFTKEYHLVHQLFLDIVPWHHLN
jgi:hypothetical protein